MLFIRGVTSKGRNQRFMIGGGFTSKEGRVIRCIGGGGHTKGALTEVSYIHTSVVALINRPPGGGKIGREGGGLSQHGAQSETYQGDSGLRMVI